MADWRELSTEDEKFSKDLETYLYRAAKNDEWTELDHFFANRQYYVGPGRYEIRPHVINWHDRLYAKLAIDAIRFTKHPELSRRIRALHEFNRRGYGLDYAYYQSQITEESMRLRSHEELSDNVIFMLYLYIRARHAGNEFDIPDLSEPIKILLREPRVRRRFANNLVELYKLDDVRMNIFYAISVLVKTTNLGPDATGCLIPELLTELLHTVQNTNADNRDRVFRPILTFFAGIYGPEHIRRALLYRVRVNATRRRKHVLALREHGIAGRNPSLIAASPNNRNDEDAAEAAVEAAEVAAPAAGQAAAEVAAPGRISISELIAAFIQIINKLTGACRRGSAAEGGAAAGAGGSGAYSAGQSNRQGGGRRTKRHRRRSSRRLRHN